MKMAHEKNYTIFGAGQKKTKTEFSLIKYNNDFFKEVLLMAT